MAWEVLSNQRKQVEECYHRQRKCMDLMLQRTNGSPKLHDHMSDTDTAHSEIFIIMDSKSATLIVNFLLQLVLQTWASEVNVHGRRIKSTGIRYEVKTTRFVFNGFTDRRKSKTWTDACKNGKNKLIIELFLQGKKIRDLTRWLNG